MSCLYKAVILYLSVFIAICEALGTTDYEVPTPTVEALYPRGFRVTLKDDGYSFFAFYGNINREFEDDEDDEGDIQGEKVATNGNKWVYRNNNVVLNVGDTIYYWIYIRRNDTGYENTDLAYTVTGFVNEDGTPSSCQAQVPLSQPTYQNTSIFFPGNLEGYDGSVISKCLFLNVQVKRNTYKDQLLFSEDFTKTSLSQLDKWDAMIQFPGEPDYPFNVYIPDNTIRIADGHLIITPKLSESQYAEGFLDLGDRCTGMAGTPECRREVAGALTIPPVTTAKITTRRSFNFMFGRVEVRAKLPSGSWLLPGSCSRSGGGVCIILEDSVECIECCDIRDNEY